MRQVDEMEEDMNGMDNYGVSDRLYKVSQFWVMYS